ncbi:MAG: hypothetical protein N4A35_16970 [Flavobacteriales bacterium]|nr:hypothetical protein [Flavobacteriales bacterium]
MKANNDQNWVKSSAIAGIAAMVLSFILLFMPFNWGVIVLLVGILVFVIVLVRNPKYYYRRMASYLIGSLVVLGSMPIIEVQAYFSDVSFAKFAAQEIQTVHYIGISFIIVVLITADLISNNKITSRNKNLKTERDQVFEKFAELEVFMRQVVFKEIKSGHFDPNNWSRVFELENYLRKKSSNLSQSFYSKSNDILLTFQKDVNSIGDYMRGVKENIDNGKIVDLTEYGESLTELTNIMYQNYRSGIDILKNTE